MWMRCVGLILSGLARKARKKRRRWRDAPPGTPFSHPCRRMKLAAWHEKFTGIPENKSPDPCGRAGRNEVANLTPQGIGHIPLMTANRPVFFGGQSMKMTVYRIEQPRFEFECPTCGYPLMVGDKAVFMADDERGEEVACSRTCAEKAIEVSYRRAMQIYASRAD